MHGIDHSTAGASALDALHEIAVLAADGRDEPAVVARLAADHASRLLAVPAAALFAWDDRRSLLVPVYETPSESAEPPMRTGEGMVGRVFASLAPLKVADYQAFADGLSPSRLRGMRAAMAVPMIVGGRPIGVLGIWSYEVRAFTDEEEQLLALFAAHVAPAFAASRVAEERDRHARILGALADLASSTAGLLDIERIAALTVTAAADLFRGTAPALGIWEPGRSRLRLLHDAADHHAEFLRYGEGALGEAFVRQEPVAVEDYRAYAGAIPESVEIGTRSVLAVPLLAGDRPVGALGLRFFESRGFSDEDVQVLQLLAAQVGPTLVAASLHAELARSETLLRQVHEAMACGVVVFDAATGLVTDVNEATLRLLGLERSQLDGRLPADIAGFERLTTDRASLRYEERPVARVIRTGRPVHGALVGYRRPDGSEFWLQHDAVPILDADGRVDRVINSIMDVTAVRSAEAARRESEAKSRFLASMSHELRTPLNSILGFAQLLEQETYGPLNDRQQRYVGHIGSSGRHLLDLVNDILDLSKVAAGQMEVAIETVALGPTATGILARLRPLADARQLDVRQAIAPGLAVRADRRRLEQVLFNLLSNAIKFTPEGGRVDLEARRRGGHVLVSVRDTGIGIPPEHQARVFDEFTQVEDGRSRRHEGTGLGLPLTRRLLELMGGGIALRSRPGAGSEFTFTLPAPD